MSKSNIEWTEQTWNPIVGCSILTPGCTNCYAMKMAARIQKMNRTGGSNSNYVNHYDGTTRKVKGKDVWTGKLAIAPEKIFLQPLSRKAPTTYFVNSMGDLFHEDCPDAWIDRVFAVMALAPQHTFQVLTKRAARMRQYCSQDRWPLEDRVHREVMAILKRRYPGHQDTYDQRIAFDRAIRNVPTGACRPMLPLPNVWLGVSTERQQEADERIPLLLQTPAAVRFISAEPLLGAIDLTNIGSATDSSAHLGINALTGSSGRPGRIVARSCWPSIDWVIVGGESGPGARPMHPDWARSMRDQCLAAGVPFFFKQWGEWTPGENVERMTGTCQDATWFDDRWIFEKTYLADTEGHVDDEPDLYRVGKKAAGRHLDGELHNAMPAVRA